MVYVPDYYNTSTCRCHLVHRFRRLDRKSSTWKFWGKEHVQAEHLPAPSKKQPQTRKTNLGLLKKCS